MPIQFQPLLFSGFTTVSTGGGGGGVTTVTASSPLSSSGGTAPNISLTGIVSPSHGGTGIANNNAFTLTFTAVSSIGGTNTGDITLTTVGSSPNADAASLSGQVLTLQPFSSSFPGVVPASGGGTTNFLRADGTWSPTPGSSGANTFLSNLTSPTAINQDLLPSITGTYSIGSTSDRFARLGIYYIQNSSGTAINVDAGDMLDTSGDISIDWQDRFLVNPAGTTVLNWSGTDLSVNTHKITNVVDPTNPQDAATKNYVDTHSGAGSITALTGDVTATGPGSVPATLATVNSNVGTFGNATNVSTFTVNAKGLITAASNTAITFPVTSVTGSGNIASSGGSTPNLTFTGVLPSLNGGTGVSNSFNLSIGGTSSINGTFSGTSSGTNTGDQTITLTGDVTGSGTGSFATTLATVNSNVGSFTNANITVNAKGLITAASSGTAGTVSSVALADGSTTPIYNISGSPVTSTGTLTFTLATQTANKVLSGPVSGGAAQPTFRLLVASDIPLISLTSGVSGVLPITNGGTGQATAPLAFAALSPMTTAGDMIYENNTPAPARLPIGTTGQVLTVVGGLPVWSNAGSGSGTVTSVALADGSTTPIYAITGSPVTTSGTLTETLINQSANTVFAGPTTGASTQPGFRALVSNDIPALTTLRLAGATSGILSITVPSVVTSYTLTLPAAVATSSGSYLSSDTSGNLSWTNPLVNIDGGVASSVYTVGQFVNGGTP